MDYTAFKALVAGYLHRSDLTSMMETFIEHGRIRMCDGLRVQEMEQYATVTLTSDRGALSSDLVEIRHVQGPNGPLEWADLNTVLSVDSESVYTVQGLDIIAPGCSTVTVYYYERPLTLVGASGSATRSVLTLYTPVWLQAALVEAYIYLQDVDKQSDAQARLDEEVRRANLRSAAVRTGSRRAANYPSINVYAGGSGL